MDDFMTPVYNYGFEKGFEKGYGEGQKMVVDAVHMMYEGKR